MPSEGNGHPSSLSCNRIPGLLNGCDLVENTSQPFSSLRGLAKRKEFITPRERGHAGYENVLKILDLKHAASPRPLCQGLDPPD